jgi:repressor LexA
MLPLTKRQREILDFLNELIQQHGYAPSLEEIGRRFNLSSLATVHKHLTNLQEKGFIRRAWNRSRSVEMVPNKTGGRAVELPLLGFVAAGAPIEAVVGNETIAVPEDLVGKRETFAMAISSLSKIVERRTTEKWSLPWSMAATSRSRSSIASRAGFDCNRPILRCSRSWFRPIRSSFRVSLSE